MPGIHRFRVRFRNYNPIKYKTMRASYNPAELQTSAVRPVNLNKYGSRDATDAFGRCEQMHGSRLDKVF